MRNQKACKEHYIESLLKTENQKQNLAKQKSEQIGLDRISISKGEAQILKFFLKMADAKKVVEIGTLTGFSALSILEAIKSNDANNSFLWTLEKSEEHANLAKEVLRDEIQNNRCEVVVGDAEQSLTQLNQKGPFDAVFIDGNKAAYLKYFDWATENIKIGGLIIADNVFLAGAVWGDHTLQRFNEKQIQAVQQMNEKAFSQNKFESVIIPTEEGLLVCKKLS